MIKCFISGKFHSLLGNDVFEYDAVAYLLTRFDIVSPYSFLEIEDEDTISFISESKLKQLYKIEPNKDDLSLKEFFYLNLSTFWTTNRQTIKIGRFIHKLIENNQKWFLRVKENLQSPSKESDGCISTFEEVHTDRYVEIFVNKFKAIYKETNNKDLFKNINLFSGEDIRKYYLQTNYISKHGSLGNSCMRYDKCQNYLDIYVDNSNICQLLIYKEPNDEKISMRALLWTLDNGEKYMDRIYSTYESDSIILMNYAREKGWLYYDDDFDSSLEPMSINVEYIYEEYPYMDTFKYLNMDTNTCSTIPEIGLYALERQDGRIDYRN